ncbi:MBL fold metallo-hydrolase [Neorhizobium vignae]|uniref:MBL fold metallo-hydrolase n=1 Tax=Neorhizobium vignae TaxID=690585 RepID=UPI00056C9258|nr:MBL fold metallo-hydrolase [Neorhizobium vignae]
MKLQLIRNATLKLSYAGRSILIDPYFAPRHSLPSYTGKSANPLTDLPLSVEEVLEGVELVIVSHLHTDHFDSVAKQRVPKHLPLICQPGDEAAIAAEGFIDVAPLEGELVWQGITITRCEGSHGLGPVRDKMGSVMGLTLAAPGEPLIYWAGDTVLYPPVLETVKRVVPDVIVSHSCGALWDGDLIVMNAAETIELCRSAPEATVVATHMEALDHATVSRAHLREAAHSAGIGPSRLLIPADGDVIDLPAR